MTKSLIAAMLIGAFTLPAFAAVGGPFYIVFDKTTKTRWQRAHPPTPRSSA
jgi:hypothetical protein